MASSINNPEISLCGKFIFHSLGLFLRRIITNNALNNKGILLSYIRRMLEVGSFRFGDVFNDAVKSPGSFFLSTLHPHCVGLLSSDLSSH